jgi:CubicO group peptidase (beta-lactamase class C family)
MNMKQKLGLAGVIFAVIMLLVISTVLWRQNQGKDYIDRLIAQYNPQGAAVVIIQNGAIAEVRNYGYANTESKTPVTENTRFKVASISKTVTAYAVMQLVDQGKLNLDQPINSYLTKWKLPDSQYDVNKVTLRTLMSHTSGITGSDEYGYQLPLPTIDEALKEKDIQLKREPGTVFEYSEFAGFGICQLAVEEVTGTKFEKYMQSNTFEPLGMEHTDYSNDNLATPYAGVQDAVPVTPIVMTGAGGVATTSQDLAKFVIALMNDEQTGNQEMFEPQQNTDSTAGVYALGIIPRALKNGLTVYEHNGTLTGWNAQFAFEPTSKNGMVILTNSDKAYYLTYALMEQWGQHVLGEKVVDSEMQQIKQYFIDAVAVLAVVFVLLVGGFLLRLKKGSLALRETFKKRVILRAVLMLCFGILYCGFLYTDIPFQILYHMDNYYLFTFFPPSFLWVNVVLALIAGLVIVRGGFGRIKR